MLPEHGGRHVIATWPGIHEPRNPCRRLERLIGLRDRSPALPRINALIPIFDDDYGMQAGRRIAGHGGDPAV
jgi:hypothetical protein